MDRSVVLCAEPDLGRSFQLGVSVWLLKHAAVELYYDSASPRPVAMSTLCDARHVQCRCPVQIHAVLVNSPYTNVITVDITLEDGKVGISIQSETLRLLYLQPNNELNLHVS